MNYYYLIGFFIFIILLIISCYFIYKFKNTKIYSLDEIKKQKEKTGKKPSYWSQYRLAFTILISVACAICAIVFFLSAFGINASGNGIL
ncbi:MAG: hypothetical protein ACRCRZ_01415 [Metamycoplasmataceae bacterium]